MKKLSKNIVRTLMVIGAMVMLMCAPVSAKTSTSVMAMKKGTTTTIKKTSKVTSSKKKVASAKKKSSTKYTITAKKAGKSTLKVYNKNGKLSQKIYLLVYTNKTMKYNTNAVTLAKGSTKTVKATVPKGCTVKYSSSDKKIAKVNSKGKITAVAKGTATIKAKVYYKDTKIKTYSKKVTVKNASSSTSSSSSSSKNSSSSKTSGTSSSSSSGNSSNSSSGFEYHLSRTSITLSGGDSYHLTVYCEKSSDVVTYKTNNDCIEITQVETGNTVIDDENNNKTAYVTRICMAGRKKGSCTIGIYVNGKLLQNFTAEVTSTDDIYYTYLDWKQNMKDEIWTDDMTDREKINAVGSYIRRNCTYISDQSDYMGWALYGGGNCIAAADLVIDIAHDLGLEAEEYLVNGTYAGHVYAIVYYEPGIGTKVDISFT